MDKLYKLSFPTKEDWEAFKAAKLMDEDSNLKPQFTIAGEGQLPKAPPADWMPDPNKPEDNGWGVYPDYSVDIISKDYTDIFDAYIIIKPNHSLRSVTGGEFEIIYK